MNFNEHCNLCANFQLNLQKGIICGLTNQKPSFDKTCPDIRFDEEFEKQLGLIHIEIKKLKKRKTSIYIQSYLFIILGFTLMLSANSLMEFTYSLSAFELKSKLIIMMVGLGLCSFGYNTLNKFKNKTKTTQAKKDRIDLVLNKYLIEYNCKIEFGEKYHGNEDIIVELKSKNNLLRSSKITYQINDFQET